MADAGLYNNLDYPVKTLKAEDYGAVGNGVTDDGAAVSAAVEALSNCGPGSTLVFERNKTYYIGSLGSDASALFEFKGCKGLTVNGLNSKFILDVKKSYVSIYGTKNCKITGMTFDYATKPAFGAVCSSINLTEGSAFMVADRDIGLESREIYTPPSGLLYWGVLNKSDSRYHMYITKYKMIDRDKKTFRVYFDMTDNNTASWLKTSLKDSGMICPMPKLGHLPEVERGFTIVENLDLILSDIDINSCCRFGMYIGRNEGTLTLDNVNFVPADNELDRNLNFTSWRDAFHVKDNRCRVIWNNCTAVGNYDDVINISSSALYVSAYDEDTRSVSLVWPESSTRLYYKIKPGDTLSVIDTSTGADCGTVEVESVTEQSDGVNKIIIKTPLENFTSCGTQLLAYFANRCAPDSEITDCNFNGTFRFRGPLTVSNSTIYNMRTWIDVEGTREGPVPRDIKFIACDIAAGKSSSIIINSYNSSENGYHVSNISFENCILEDNTLAIGSNDKGYVSLIDCKRHDGTNIE